MRGGGIYGDIFWGKGRFWRCPKIKGFRVNVLLEGLQEGVYTSDFVIVKADGGLMIRECVSRKHLTKPMTAKLLDASRNYWKSHGVSDWGIVVEREGVVNE